MFEVGARVVTTECGLCVYEITGPSDAPFDPEPPVGCGQAYNLKEVYLCPAHAHWSGAEHYEFHVYLRYADEFAHWVKEVRQSVENTTS